MRIDAEVRFWHRSNTPVRFQETPLLNQDYLPQHLAPHLMEHGFQGCIAMLETELAALSSMQRDTLIASRPIFGHGAKAARAGCVGLEPGSQASWAITFRFLPAQRCN